VEAVDVFLGALFLPLSYTKYVYVYSLQNGDSTKEENTMQVGKH
jgi:hypothetical protein